MRRTVPDLLHVDADAFFAAVEQRDRPSLRGRPVVVGGLGPRGVVATASYEARASGIRSAMPTGQARRLATARTAFLRPRFAAYRESSEAVMELLAGLTPLVEPVSLDEAYADLAASASPPGSREEVVEVARRLRAAVRARVGVTVSVGAATSRTVAKVASDAAKPDGLLVVDPGGEADFLAPRPVRVLQGVGPVTEQRLVRAGVATVGALAALPRERAVELLGSDQLWRFARGDDPRPVVPPGPAKTLSVETTFDSDLAGLGELRARLDVLIARLAARLRDAGMAGSGVTVKARFADFRTVTRAAPTGGLTADPGRIADAARRALADLASGHDLAVGVRLLGVGVHGLADHEQGTLFDGGGVGGGPGPGGAGAPGAGGAGGGERDVAGGAGGGGGADLGGGPGGADGHSAGGAGVPEGDAGGAGGAGGYPEGAGDDHGFAGGDSGDSGDSGDAGAPGVPFGDALSRPPTWWPGQDVEHVVHGRGWVQGAGHGVVTVRLERRADTRPGPVRTFRADDPALAPAAPEPLDPAGPRSPG